ncbi:MAG: malate synthase G, partial [Acetobacteraceae bacterium]
MEFQTAGGVQVARTLYDFVNDEAIPGTGVESAAFWEGFGALVRDLAPRNKALLEKRDELQRQIDAWHVERRGRPIEFADYTEFLRGIGYLQAEPADFLIGTKNVDPEIATIAGPQLVVPVTNARYALNAANARWGSLYDALYGTDVIPEDGGATRGPGYNANRGARVIAKAREILDQAAPLAIGTHRDATGYKVDSGRLTITLKDHAQTALARPEQFVGYRGCASDPSAVLLKHHGLHIEIVIDRTRPIGQQDSAGIADVVLEAAITTIQDCEDSVACVDAVDKVEAYRNWLGLMKGTLT